jgi:hypothetical protein
MERCSMKTGYINNLYVESYLKFFFLLHLALRIYYYEIKILITTY